MRALRPVLAFVLLALSAVPALAQRQVLPAGAEPVRYDLHVTPDAAAGTFTGKLKLTLTADRPMPAVTLNALGLTVSKAAVDGKPVAPKLDETAQTLTLPTSIGTGAHTVELDYAGKINTEAYGLFSVDYTGPGGAKQRMLSTQFEPGDARRFVPSFDQPDKKAIFVLSVDVPKGELAISNMPEAARTPAAGGRTRVAFQPSPKMSSYLLYLAMGDLERISAKAGAVDIGVVARRGEAEKGRFALESAVELLGYYNTYFGTPYPLPKLDMIAAPGSGGFGAMENWGAILYFDRYLLLDPALSSAADKQNVFIVVAHEMAHQWFGNLVTMQWWDDLWLNEGFASWMENKATDALHPEWRVWLTAAGGREGAMEIDARPGTHPVVQRVDTIDQANLAFDTITYEKGQSVVRMLEAHVGETAFRDGVRAYMAKHKYGNTITADLWREVEAASRQPVVKMADSFTRREGVPLLQVGDCRNGAVELAQQRFSADGPALSAGEGWTLPVAVRSGAGEARRDVLEGAGARRVQAGSCGAVVVNAGQDGYMRTLYSAGALAPLTAGFSALPPEDQLGLLYDYWAFARADRAPAAAYLDFAAALPEGADPRVAGQAAGVLSTLASWSGGRRREAEVRGYALGRLNAMFARVGWEARPGEGDNVATLREQLIRTLGRQGDAAVAAEARRRVLAAERDPTALPAGIREATLRAAGAGADAAFYDALLGRARASTSFLDQSQAYGALAEARDPALADRTLKLALDEATPRPLRLTLVRGVARSHPEKAWRFVEANAAALEALLDPLQRLSFPPEIASASSDPAIADALRAYAARRMPEGSRGDAERAEAAIRSAARVRERVIPQVEAWVARRPRGG